MEYHVLLLGDVAVGKSSLCLQHNIFQRTMLSYMPTIGTDLAFKRFRSDRGTVVLKIWDFSGSPSYHFMLQSHIVRADFIMYCFDVTNVLSFANVEHIWMNIVRRCARQHLPGMLVATKTDQRRTVTIEEAAHFAAITQLRYVETSSVTNLNVERCFSLVQDILEAKREEKIVPRSISPPQRNTPCCFQ